MNEATLRINFETNSLSISFSGKNAWWFYRAVNSKLKYIPKDDIVSQREACYESLKALHFKRQSSVYLTKEHISVETFKI